MTPPPVGFRDVDVHTHLHPDWLARAIQRWFAERSDWKLESREFIDLLGRYPNLYLDTTMAFAPEGLRRVRDVHIATDDLVRWQDRILFGSDFPNLPYPYEAEREALWARDLPMAAYEKIFRDNAVRVFGL